MRKKGLRTLPELLYYFIGNAWCNTSIWTIFFAAIRAHDLP